MYTAFYGLREKPFSLTPNPAFLFLAESHREALAHLLYGLEQGEGFIVITGEVGTGKTTLCRSLLGRIEAETEIAILFNPSRNAIELLQSISEEFGLPAEGLSRRQLLSALNRFLMECNTRGRRVVLIVDEAQNLSSATLEQVRLLSNLETAASKLIQIILLGQPELDAKLDSEELRQLRQRVSVRWKLDALSPRDTAAYVQHRLQVAAGAERSIFSASALREIHRLTGGIPRLVNVLSDRALLAGYAAGRHRIEKRLVKAAASEVHLAAPRRSKRVASPFFAGGLASAAAGLLALFYFGPALDSYFPASMLPISIHPPPMHPEPQLEVASDPGDFLPASGARSPTAPPPVGSAPPFEGREAVVGEVAEGNAAVTVIVELPVAPRFEVVSNESERAEAVVAEGAPALASEVELSFLDDEGHLLEAILMDRDTTSTLSGATAAVLELHGFEVAGLELDSLSAAIAEFRSHGLAVLNESGSDFSRLRSLNYPTLAELQTREGESRIVALIGIEGEVAELVGVGGGRSLHVPIRALEEQWSGGAWVVWHPYLEIPQVIERGESGAGVLWLQEALGRLGYVEVKISGLYDEATALGVSRFQRRHAVRVDGVAGPQTQMLLYGTLDEFAPPQLEEDDAG
jgi:general secretion pathway protein A